MTGGDTLHLLPADVDDAAEVASLVRLAYRGDESRTGWTTEADLLADDRIDADRVRARLESPDSVVLTLRDRHSRLIACCELIRRSEHLAYFGMFAIRPDLQAAGLGRQVLAAAERHAASEWRSNRIEMTVIAQRSELIAWYERRGYRITGETRPFPYAELRGGPALRDDLYFVVLERTLTAKSKSLSERQWSADSSK